ncbi:MarR family transcriptional regulator [Corynebacterium poyangense]|uniref:MarR family transcriptional regulator n=1 Tax=Corynebacterium poyangense TaxID=2684405 RepID=A0A7H0SQK3_9CORY|nr:MarR family transcriptional regulator [Corynebacterium poyangense]MBZ8178280.1 MarR family transcriptional regulator [Corynebacterium poyangense]QNQ90828.1 MarR family transcriptional regulator [Corynebacterium poyangense]
MSTSRHPNIPEDHEHLLDSPLATEMQFLLARATARGSGHANQALASLGIKVRQYSVLSLACSESKLTQRELALFLGLDPSQVVGIVDQLQLQGLVERTPDPTDKRSRIISATHKGRQLYQQAQAITHASENHTLAPLTPGERALLLELLIKIAF